MSDQYTEDGVVPYDSGEYGEYEAGQFEGEITLTPEQLAAYIDGEVEARVAAVLPDRDFLSGPLAVQQVAAAQQGDVGLIPVDESQYRVASGILDTANTLVHQSPGAQAFAERIQREGNELVLDQIDRHAAELGGTVTDRAAAIGEAERLFAAALREGKSNSEAQAWALREAAKIGTKKQSYKDIEERFAVKTHGQTLKWDHKRS